MTQSLSEKIVVKIKEFTGHEHIILTSRGNSAIYVALSLAKEFGSNGKILIPDQGGWLTYKQYSEKLKLKVSELETDYGVVDINDLKLKLKGSSALIFSNPASYYAEQPLEEIYDVCKEKAVVVLDVTGSIGTNTDGKYADILVCSFGKWKPVNIGYGGFISFNDNKYLEFVEKLTEEKQNLSFEGSSEKYNQLLNQLDNLYNKYKFFSEINKKIKNDLKDFDIIHKNKKGINVIVKFEDEIEKEKIIKYCNNNKYDYVLCPKYIKVNEKAVSIEVKRLK
jgi:dTDP-4-amino-4,6-dideoxygalactose transaminase